MLGRGSLVVFDIYMWNRYDEWSSYCLPSVRVCVSVHPLKNLKLWSKIYHNYVSWCRYASRWTLEVTVTFDLRRATSRDKITGHISTKFYAVADLSWFSNSNKIGIFDLDLWPWDVKLTPVRSLCSLRHRLIQHVSKSPRLRSRSSRF